MHTQPSFFHQQSLITCIDNSQFFLSQGFDQLSGLHRNCSSAECEGWRRSNRVIVADSAFASVNTLVAARTVLGLYFIGVVKTAHKNFPKAALETWYDNLEAMRKQIAPLAKPREENGRRTLQERLGQIELYNVRFVLYYYGCHYSCSSHLHFHLEGEGSCASGIYYMTHTPSEGILTRRHYR